MCSGFKNLLRSQYLWRVWCLNCVQSAPQLPRDLQLTGAEVQSCPPFYHFWCTKTRVRNPQGSGKALVRSSPQWCREAISYMLWSGQAHYVPSKFIFWNHYCALSQNVTLFGTKASEYASVNMSSDWCRLGSWPMWLGSLERGEMWTLRCSGMMAGGDSIGGRGKPETAAETGRHFGHVSPQFGHCWGGHRVARRACRVNFLLWASSSSMQLTSGELF